MATKIKIKQGSIKTLQIKIVGTSPLIVNKWDDKAIQSIKIKVTGGKKEKPGARNPEEEFNNKRYRFKDGGDGFPVNAAKALIINACRNTEHKMTEVKQYFHVRGDEEDSFLFRLNYKEIVCREDIMSLAKSGAGADIRWRPQYNGWSAIWMIDFDSDCISTEQIIDLVVKGGKFCGLGEWRPNSKKPGTFGTFEIKEIKEIKMEENDD